jgi:hypothetical protein
VCVSPFALIALRPTDLSELRLAMKMSECGEQSDGRMTREEGKRAEDRFRIRGGPSFQSSGAFPILNRSVCMNFWHFAKLDAFASELSAQLFLLDLNPTFQFFDTFPISTKLICVNFWNFAKLDVFASELFV